jgi:hypothetical protein
MTPANDNKPPVSVTFMGVDFGYDFWKFLNFNKRKEIL